MKRLGKPSIVLGVVVVLLGASVPAAQARTDNRSKPVVYVHGYNPFGDGAD